MSTLVIRLPNHLGDACMALPAIAALAATGARPILAGRRWAVELFEGHGWPVVPLAGGLLDRVRTLRGVPREDGGRIDAVLLTNSFSSALELRLAGLHAAGFARDGRSLLLAAAVPVPGAWREGQHTIDYYLDLARALGAAAAPGTAPRLQLAPAAGARAAQSLRDCGAASRYVVLCPTAQGLHQGRIKCWDGFGRLCDELLAAGTDVVVCPGPGEGPAARAATPRARFIAGLDLGAFAALLAGSALVVANDSGPGHLGAAVGARLVGVFGVTDPTRTRPRGAGVRILGGMQGWPDYAAVAAAVGEALAAA